MKNIKITLLSLALLISVQSVAYAQRKNNDEMGQMLDYSRPGKDHETLGLLAGTWKFQDAKLSFVRGTLVRKLMYNGRFFEVEITGGKLLLPIADGKNKEDYYKSMQIEGYDNVRMKFFTTSINNHIGSDIQMQTGSYDTAKKEFTFEWDDELIKGKPKTNRRVVKLVDDTHYVEIYYEQKGGIFVKTRELDYTKSLE